MKWTNKGHEYDEIGKNFINKKVYIWGAGKRGEHLFNRMKPLDCVEAFIDRDIQKQKNGFLGKQVFSQSEFLKFDKDKVIVIVASDDTINIRCILISLGYVNGINLFDEWMFNAFYFSIFALYAYDKLILYRRGLTITEKCSLKCKFCNTGVSHLNKSSHINIDNLIRKMKNIFLAYDYLDIFNFSGGEALLHPDIYNIIVDYLFTNYSGRFGELHIYSNGYSNMSDELISLIKKYPVKILWSNYTNYLDNSAIVYKIRENIERYRSQGVEVIEINQTYWYDYGFNDKYSSDENEDELIAKFNECARCPGIPEDDAVSPCAIGYMLGKNMLSIIDKEDTVPLISEDKRHKHILLESNNGFCEKGYLQVCRYCRGFGSINTKKVIPATDQI